MNVEAQRASDGVASAPIVARQHHRSNSKHLQPRDAGRRVLARLVSQGNESNDALANEYNNDSLTFMLKRLDAGRYIFG